jgi:aldehyde dehydrogenase (NAD+)
MLDIKSPFGGMKQSGIGREFAEEGQSEYVELQTIVSAGKLPALQQDRRLDASRRVSQPTGAHG